MYFCSFLLCYYTIRLCFFFIFLNFCLACFQFYCFTFGEFSIFRAFGYTFLLVNLAFMYAGCFCL